MDTEYPFHTAFLLVFMAILGIRMYYHGYADATSGVKQTTKGEGAFRALRPIIGLPLLACYVAYILWPPWMAWAQFPLDPMFRWIGLGLSIVGVVFLAWIQKHLSRNFTGTVQIRPGGHVVTTGPYAYVRHPMYACFLLLAIGTLLLTANWVMGGSFLLLILLVIIVRTSIEEAALEKAYGEEYKKYKAKTGALFPRIFG